MIVHAEFMSFPGAFITIPNGNVRAPSKKSYFIRFDEENYCEVQWSIDVVYKK
jgi:hypothetical protein